MVPQIKSKYFSQISTDTKTIALAWAVQKIDFLGGFWGSGPQKIQETKLRLQLNNFTQKLDFDVLWFRRRAHKIYEEKKRKNKKKIQKQKKLIAAKCGW